MAIDKSGKWWVGTSPGDIKEYLEAYTADVYPADEFRLAKCTCGSVEFKLDADNDEGVAKRKCIHCDKEHLICDSDEFWKEAEPESWKCIECGSEVANIGVGFSLSKNKQAVRWLYVGERCSECGVLGYFVGWKIAYEPSLHLIEQV